MILTSPRCCRECAKPLDTERHVAIAFCDTACRITWRNRRSTRGAELYDLFMALRYDRETAKDKGLWALMCRMAQQWNEEDKAANRRSFFTPQETLTRTVHYAATRNSTKRRK